jgi:hypothetical protein
VVDDAQGQGSHAALEAEVRRLSETVALLQAQLTPPVSSPGGGTPAEPELPVPARAGGPGSPAPAADARMSRRGALALGAAAAVGIGAVADSVLSATPAWATTGNMQYGASNNAGSAETDLTSTASSETLNVTNAGTGAGLTVSCTSASPALLATGGSDTSSAIEAQITSAANDAPALFAITDGIGNAVLGNVNNQLSTAASIEGQTRGLGIALHGRVTNVNSVAAAVSGENAGSGAGVEADSATGYGIAATGGLAPLFLQPAASAGAPTSGTHAVGELYVDSNGVVFACQGAGTPGTWVQVLFGGAANDLGDVGTTVDSADGVASILIGNSASGAAVAGTDQGTGTGVGVTGQIGNPANSSAAVYGLSGGTGPGVFGDGISSYGVKAQGGLAPLLLVPATSAGPPTSGTHVLGELYVDLDGVQYRCAAAGTPGTWVPQYSVVPLPAPVRVIATPTSVGGISGPLVPGSAVHTSSVLTGADGIPEGAIGVVGNLALSGVGGALLNGYGVLTIFPAGDAVPATANINAGAGCFALSNTVTVAFGTGADAGQISLVWNGGGPVPDAEAYLDVTAYLL